MFPNAGRRCWFLLGASLFFGCGDEDTSLRLKLVVDPQLNSEQQVLAKIDTIELIFDSPSGFANVEQGPSGELTLRNEDGDPAMELVLTKQVAGLISFPLYRLLPGSNLDRGFTITAKGLRGKEVAAAGGSAEGQFAAGQSPEITIPLNLRPGYRAPRVMMSLPHDGQHAVPQALANIYVEFSTQISAGSIASNLSLLHHASSGEEREVPGSWQINTINVNELGFGEKRTAATFQRRVDCVLNAGDFRIDVKPGITDLGGAALDQDAQRPGANGFKSVFVVVVGNNSNNSTLQASAKPTPPDPLAACDANVLALGCTSDPDCNPDSGTLFTCRTLSGESIGRCVPGGSTCGECPAGYVCASGEEVKPPDPWQTPEQLAPPAACVRDCRKDGCPQATGTRCDFNTGLCAPCLINAATGNACFLPCGTTPGCAAGAYCYQNTRCVACPPNAGCY